MKFEEAFKAESKYLSHEDLKGRDRLVVIESYQHEMIGQGDEAKRKVVIYLQNAPKGWICNPTNGATIASLYGSEMDDWIGREIVLYTDERIPFQGRLVKGIRVRAPKQRTAPPNGGREQVFEERKGYTLSTTRAKDPIEDALDDPPGF